MKKNTMSLAVICENKKEREHALQVAQQAGIAFGEWKKVDRGNTLRVYEHTGDWHFLYWNAGADTALTYDDFIEKYGSQPEPTNPEQRIAQLEVEISNLKERLKKYEPQVYDGVFSFDYDGANCRKGKHWLFLGQSSKEWLCGLAKGLSDPHTLAETPTHERGQFYLLQAADPTAPQSYALCMGDWFVGWGKRLPIERNACDVSLMKVVPINN